MNFIARDFNLLFKHPYTISKGSKTHQPSLIIELNYMGIKGYGEAPAISYYNLPIEKMQEDLERKKIFLQKFSFSDPERYWHYLHPHGVANYLGYSENISMSCKIRSRSSIS